MPGPQGVPTSGPTGPDTPNVPFVPPTAVAPLSDRIRNLEQQMQQVQHQLQRLDRQLKALDARVGGGSVDQNQGPPSRPGPFAQ
jgi:Tfp pilus assembly protein FimV